MMVDIRSQIAAVRQTLPSTVTLVVVSKFQPREAIEVAYNAGERDFGESHVQELMAKYQALPKDIRWHFIGHLQTNKVKYIVPFVHLIHSVDSLKLLEVINKEAAKIDRFVDILLEVHVAREATKSGFLSSELPTLDQLKAYPRVRVVGLMTMATNTDDEAEIRRCFKTLHNLADEFLGPQPLQLSMGMSDDYPIAIEEGATMIRVGSRIFGERDYSRNQHEILNNSL